MYSLNTHPGAQISVRFALRPAVFDMQACRKSEMHRMTPEWPQALNCQKHNVYTEYSSPRPKFHSVSLYDQPFWRYKLAKYRKRTQWPQNDINHLIDKSKMYTLNTHPRGPHFTPFRSTIARSPHRDFWFPIPGFWFPVPGYNGELPKFVKNRKLKFQKSKE